MRINSKVILLVAALLGVFIIYETINFKQQTKKSGQKSMPSNITKTDKVISGLEDRLKREPKNIDIHVALATAYLQKVRESADTQYYARVEKLLLQADNISKDNPEVLVTKAFLAYGRHDFYKGLNYAQQAVDGNPRKALYYGALADGQVEVGKYEEAVKSVQKMVDIRPDLSSYNRIAYLRELNGDIVGAQNALNLAISAGAASLENVAFSQVELGKLYLRTDLVKAADFFEKSLITYPDYAPGLEGLGKVALAQNDSKKAQSYFEKAFKVLPTAQYAMDLGDLHIILDNKVKADQYYTLADIAYQKSFADGVNIDLEYALFLADVNLNAEKAVEKAQAAYRSRPTIYTADALAWTLYKNNASNGASQYVTEALKLGEFDPSIIFHAGLIAEKNGDSGEAKRLLQKAITIHPHFSILYSGIAKEKLKALSL